MSWVDRAERRCASGTALFALVSLVLLAFGTACQRQDPAVVAHIEKSQQLVQEGRPVEALAELEQAIALAPDEVELRLVAGGMASKLDRPKIAIKHWLAAFENDPSQTRVAVKAATIQMTIDPARALRICDRILEAAPDHARALLLKANASLSMGRHEAALASARRAAELRPGLGEAHFLIADLLTRSIEESPESLDQDFAEADAAYAAALAEMPDERRAATLIRRAQLHALRTEDESGAREAYEALLAYGETHPRSARRAASEALGYAQRIDDPELLERALELIVVSDPFSADAWLALARLEERRGGDPDGFLAAAIERRSTNVEARVARARLRASGGDVDGAVESLLAATGEGVGVDRLLEVAAQLRLGSRQIPAAVEIAERLDAEWPGSRGAAVTAARVGLARRRPFEGRAKLAEYVEREQDAIALELLALIDHKSGYRRDEASDAIERAEDIASDFSPARTRLAARIHHAAARPEETLAALHRLERNGLALTPDEFIYRVHSFYLIDRTAAGDALLSAIVSVDEPPIPAVVEFAARHRESDPDRVRELLDRELARKPLDDGLLVARLQLDLAQDRPEQALKKLESFLAEGGPLSLRVVAARASVYTALDRLEEAEVDRMAVLQLSANQPESIRDLADLYRHMGRLEELAMSFDAVSQSGALGMSGRLIAARIRIELGDFQAALEILEPLFEVSESEYGSARMNVAMARALAELGRDLPRARKLARKGTAMLGRDADAHAAFGLVQLREGRDLKASDTLRRSVELDRSKGLASSSTLVHYGEALRSLGRAEQARAAFERALAIDETNVAARNALDGLDAKTGAS